MTVPRQVSNAPAGCASPSLGHTGCVWGPRSRGPRHRRLTSSSPTLGRTRQVALPVRLDLRWGCASTANRARDARVTTEFRHVPGAWLSLSSVSSPPDRGLLWSRNHALSSHSERPAQPWSTSPRQMVPEGTPPATAVITYVHTCTCVGSPACPARLHCPLRDHTARERRRSLLRASAPCPGLLQQALGRGSPRQMCLRGGRAKRPEGDGCWARALHLGQRFSPFLTPTL